MKNFLLVSIILLMNGCNLKNKTDKDQLWLAEFIKKNIITEIQSDEHLESFSMMDSTGQKFDSKQVKGKVVLLNFFATWCPPCIAELPDFEKYHKSFDSQKFQFVAVNAKEAVGRVAAFMKRNKFSFPALIDSKGELLSKYNVISLPASMIFDKQGKLRYTIRGVRDWASEDFNRFFKILMEEK